MENASKALIIAGAILISIVLISLGVIIIGQGQSVVNDSNMDQQAVSTWNQKWTQYEGTSVSGSNVNTLISQVLSSNVISNRDGDVAKVIRIVAGTGGTATYRIGGVTNTYNGVGATGTTATANWGTSACTTKARSGVTYTVTLAYNQLGYVNQITINPNS